VARLRPISAFDRGQHRLLARAAADAIRRYFAGAGWRERFAQAMALHLVMALVNAPGAGCALRQRSL
jgi:hypothetical protein